MTFGKRLKKLRNKKGLTLKDLANKFDKSKTAFSNYENDYRKPDFELIKELANYFNVTVDYLVDFKTSYVKESCHNNIKELEIVPVINKITSDKAVFDKENIIDHRKVAFEKIKGGDYFYFKAEDNSLTNVGIHKRDDVLVRKQARIENGNIAVVMVNKDNARLKRVHQNGSQLILQTNDSNESPEFVNENEVKIIGKAVEVVHKL